MKWLPVHDFLLFLFVASYCFLAVESKFSAYKHVANCVYPPFAYVLSAQLAQAPIALGLHTSSLVSIKDFDSCFSVESFVFCTIVYFMAGLTPEASRYFFFVLCGFLSDVFMSTMLRVVAFASPDLQVYS